MRSALYYPHTTIYTERLLKTALLLWDQLYVIAPWRDFTPDYGVHITNEAFAVIGRCHYPSDEEKRHAHELVEDFVSRPLPPAFDYLPLSSASYGYIPEPYEMYPQKLAPKTWKLLERCNKINKWNPIAGHTIASRPTGLILMNIIADCCAGNTLARITDLPEAYASLAGLLMQEVTPEIGLHEAREQLVPVAIKVIDPSSVSLESLIDLRKREDANAEGSQIRNLRHRLADRVEEQAKRLLGADSALGKTAIIEEFETAMRDDYRDLSEALRAKSVQTLGTKQLMVALVMGVGSIATTLYAPSVTIPTLLSGVQAAVSIGGLLSTKSKFAEKRRALLREHPTAYLYEGFRDLRW